MMSRSSDGARPRVLVVGGSGFVGSSVVAEARRRGYEVLGTQSRPRPSDLIAFDLAEHRIADRLPASFRDAESPLFAAVCFKYGPMERYAGDAGRSEFLEVERTIQLVNDLLALGARPICLSTSYVFDGKAGYYPDAFPRNPISAYGRNKARVEAYLDTVADQVLTLRLDKIVGDAMMPGHLFAEWFAAIETGKPITCIANQILSPTYVRDVAMGVLNGCESGLLGIYNFANPEFFSRDELARQFATALGLPADVRSRPQETFGFTELRPLRSYLDASQFAAATGMRYTPMRRVFHTYTINRRAIRGGTANV